MRAARFMKWGATPLAGLALLVAIMIAATSEWYYGVAVFVVTWAALFIFGYSAARCPHCGQVWWSGMGTLPVSPWFGAAEFAAQEDETESMVCRRCRLDIGLGLRDS
jgi:hypothetical protein